MPYPPGVSPKEAQEKGIPLVHEEFDPEDLKGTSTEYLTALFLKLAQHEEENKEIIQMVREELDTRGAIMYPKTCIQ